MQFEVLRAVQFLLYFLAFLASLGALLLFRKDKKLCSGIVLMLAVAMAFGVQIFSHFFTFTEKEDVKSMSNTMLRQSSDIRNTDLSEIKPKPVKELDLEAELAKEKAKTAEAAKGL